MAPLLETALLIAGSARLSLCFGATPPPPFCTGDGGFQQVRRRQKAAPQASCSHLSFI